MAIRVKGSSANSFKGSSASARVSLQPLPGRISHLRSKGATMQEDDSALFDFDKKTAVLSMSAVDLRSRLFREGFVARAHLVVTVGQNEFVPYVFLPALVDAAMNSDNRMFALPMLSAGLSDDNKPLAANIVLEVSPTVDSGFVSDTLSPGDLEKQLRLAHILKLKNTKVKGQYMHSPEPVTVTTTIRGIINFEFNASHMPMVRLEACMSSSGTKVPVDIHKHASMPWWVRGKDAKAYKRSRGLLKTGTQGRSQNVPGFTMDETDGKSSITMTSQYPDLDCLCFRLYTGPSEEEEVGQVSIPVRALLARERDDPELKEVFSSHIMAGDGQRHMVGDWSICLEGTRVSAGKTAPIKVAETTFMKTDREKAEEALREREAEAEPEAAAKSKPAPKMGWMESAADEDDVSMYQAAPNTTTNVRRAPAVNGSLMGCVYGFVCKSRVIPKSVSALANTHLNVAMSMQPEGLKKTATPSPDGTAVLRAVLDSSGDDEGGYAFLRLTEGSIISMPITWSPQQRKAVYMSVVATLKHPALSRIYQASTSLDVTALTDKDRSPSFSSLLPLREANGEVLGYLVCAFTFTNSKLSLPHSALTTSATLQSTCSNLWGTLISDVFPASRLKLALGDAVEHVRSNNIALQAVLSPLELATTAIGTVADMIYRGHTVSLHIMVGAGLKSSHVVVDAVKVEGNRVIWEKPEIVTSFAADMSPPCSALSDLMMTNCSAIQRDRSRVL